jgi:replication initiation protein RepC
LRLAHVASQAAAKQRPPDAAAHKWNVYRDLCAARSRLGLTERSLALLNGLLTFHPETVLTGNNLVVFPSNEQLSLRAHGMPPSTMRRHFAVLVDAGVIIRRDSPNGKRYARKGRGGAIDHAFGFDLAPMIARAAEFAALAEEVRAEDQALRFARERITLARRDIGKIIATGLEEAVPVPVTEQGPTSWEGFQALYRSIVGRIPRTPVLAEISPIAGELAALADKLLNLLEVHIKHKELSVNDAQNERHKQKSNPDTQNDLEPAFQESGAPDLVAPTVEAKRTPETHFPLGMVLQACPDINDYARGGISHWRDLTAAAGVARAALGISPSAWEAAESVMGELPAAIVVAAILQRGAAIASAGGYLRELTRKAEVGEFTLGPMLMALIGRRKREKKRA